MTVSNEKADKGESICFLIIPTTTTAAAVIIITAAATEVSPGLQDRPAQEAVRDREAREESKGRWGLKDLSDFRGPQARQAQQGQRELPVQPELWG